ncbi:hypothetical protein [Hyalangium versicolor]|uniref:hypothetical protein n=1 Tax=Hyalangium versicolor TaxID=2861190 RepID=UPI001CCB5F45|nr:hypothetical protein [Hyalangium versicolor]
MAGPAGNIFSLGVTACGLATGAYPEIGTPRKDEPGIWNLDSLVLPPALFSSRVPPPMREVILRMLLVRPEQRGTAARLPQVLKQTADSLTLPARIRVLPCQNGRGSRARRPLPLLLLPFLARLRTRGDGGLRWLPQPQVILNGHCWERLELNHERCDGIGGQAYQGACYVPVLPRGSKRPTTSSPRRPQ